MAQRVNQLWNGRSNTHYHKPKQGRLSSLFPKSSQISKPFSREKVLFFPDNSGIIRAEKT